MGFFQKKPIVTQYDAVARLYEYQDRIFVCSVSAITETDSISELDYATADAALGSAVLKHLAEFSPKPLADLTGYKLENWAAFRASGAKSGKGFERDLWHVDLAIMNSAVLISARPRLSIRDELSAHASANKHLPDQVGAAIRRALAGAKALRECDLV